MAPLLFLAVRLWARYLTSLNLSFFPLRNGNNIIYLGFLGGLLQLVINYTNNINYGSGSKHIRKIYQVLLFLNALPK